MTRIICIFPQLLYTYGILIGYSYALIGRKVRFATFYEFQFTVAICEKDIINYTPQNRIFGTGSLINKKLVLTSASGLIKKNQSEVEIIAGHRNVLSGQNYDPELWITYIEWMDNIRETKPSIHDIAIMKLKGEGVHDVRITPSIAFPLDIAYMENGTVTTAGWGYGNNGKKPMVFQTARVRVLPNEECNERGTRVRNRTFRVPPYYFCTKADPWILSTAGDGGGPVMFKNKLVGINVGTTPALNKSEHNQTWLNENLMNSHLRVGYYQHFIKQFMNKYQ